MNHTNKDISIALVIVSDRVSAGKRADGVQSAVSAFLDKQGNRLASVEIVPDEKKIIGKIIESLADSSRFDLILTAGGTGVAPRDVTPEATIPLLDRLIPGIPEAMRAESMKITNQAALARGVAGLRNNVMIVNLPGSPRAAVENLGSVFTALLHGIAKAQGDPSDCDPSLVSGGKHQHDTNR